jgi:sRNA-binding carbon storage regulator CsrA
MVPMTQLWRRANEEVAIGEDVTVRVLEVGLTFVRLGITTRGQQPDYREVELTCQTVASPAEETSNADPLLDGRPRFS